MPKKKIIKRRSPLKRKKASNSHVFIGLAVILFGLISLIFLSKSVLSTSHVLGTNTLLARGGDDSGDDGDESSHSGSNNESNSSNSGSSNESGSSGHNESNSSNQSTSDSSSGSSQSNSGSSNTTGSTTVTPKITTEQKHVENSDSDTEEVEDENELEQETEDNQEPVEVSSKDQQLKINLKKHGTVIELRSSNGKIELHAKQEDGTEIELEDDSLDVINDELQKESDTEIEQDDSGNFVIKHGTTRARTTLPVSINLATNELVVKTANGVKVLTVLPDDAVKKLISLNIIDTVESDANNSVNLTELNDSAVFEVKGVDDQKLLGIIPVKIHKTANLSAEDGTVKKSSESLGQALLDLVSF